MRLILLSDKFYKLYGNYPEIMKKRNRPYVCLEIYIDGMRFAVPFRHHISHRYAFFTGEGMGLDYSKAVVLTEPGMISPELPHIDQAEYDAIKGRDTLIENGMRKYYKLVRNALKYPNSQRYTGILQCSALKYFMQETPRRP